MRAVRKRGWMGLAVGTIYHVDQLAYDDGRLARWLEARPAPSSLAGAPVGSIVGSARLSDDVWIIVAAQKTGPVPHEIEVRLAAVDGKVRTVVER